jgi:NAD(P)-dependent dehydrogenase (short-subunit alcohol dehydrogenase family)
MKTVLITGANRGLGLELARQYAADGWSVIAACRDLRDTHALDRLPGEIDVVPLDLADATAIATLPQRLRQRPVDLLINNAGIGGGRHGFGAIDAKDFADVMRINCLAPLLLMQAMADQIADSDERKMVAIGSRMGSIAEGIAMGDPDDGGDYAYRCAKAALNMAIATAAFDLKPRGIMTAVLHPGWIQTEMGGPLAELPVATSAAGLRHVIAGLAPTSSGGFFTWEGDRIAW